MNERGEIEIGSPIKLKFVMDQLVCAVWLNSIFGKLVFGDIFKGTIARSIRKRRVIMRMMNCLVGACLSSKTQNLVRIHMLRDSLACSPQEFEIAYLMKNHFQFELRLEKFRREKFN